MDFQGTKHISPKRPELEKWIMNKYQRCGNSEISCNESDDQEKKRVKGTWGRKPNEENWNKDESGELRRTIVLDI